MPDDKQKTGTGTSPPEGGKPGIDGITLKGRLVGNTKSLGDALRTITFLEVALEKENVEAVYVEKRDINKMPYLFSILRIGNEQIEVMYSIPSGMAPHRRRLDVVMYILNILSVIEPYYKVDNRTIYQLLEKSVRDLTSSITPEYAKLYTAYDTLKKEVVDLRKRTTRMSEENNALTQRNFELKGKNDEFRLRLQQLEGLSDDALKNRVQEWVTEHNGEINIYEFCKVHRATESRVEEILNRLVNEGYLEVVQ